MRKLAQPAHRAYVLAAVIVTAVSLSNIHQASAQDVWTGADAAHSINWTDATNWQAGTAPLPYDSLTFSGGVIANSNGFPNGTAFDGITFSAAASGFNLVGNSILLSGNILGTNNGIADNSSTPQAVSLNLNLDWGYYTFTGNSSPGLALDGTLTLNQGGLAFFDPYVTSTSLTTDGTGLIAGLDGAGLTYSAGLPTGLATISGGSIQAYNNYTVVTPGGTIPSGNNIELNSSGAAGAYTASSTTVNTITSIQSGNSGGTATDTINNTGTLTLSNYGGLYVFDPAAGTKTDFVLSGGNLTAGTVGSPATMVLGVNGTSGNQAEINAVIQDNGTGGPVTLIYTGNGSMCFNKANTYSGGTYITQGQLEASNSVNNFGTGPVYVAGGAGVYLYVGGTYTNNFYLSPGTGDTSTGAAATGGALVWYNSATLAGTINLLGPAVTTAPGDRITANYSSGDTLTVSGQITGTGTLNIAGAHTANYILANTNTSTPNNWQGGLIIGAKSSVNVYFKMGATNQMPNGPNAGNVTLIVPSSSIYARLDMNGYNATINGLNASGGGTYAQIADEGSVSSTLTIGADNASGAFSGSSADGGLAKALNLVKIGAGTQILSGTLSHYGTTTVSNGIFELSGTMPNSTNIIVVAGGTLDGSESANGGLTVGSSQTLSGNGTVIGTTTVNGTIAAIVAANSTSNYTGTLTNNGNMILAGGATNICYLVNASGAAGSASSSSLVLLTNGQLTISASAASPIHVKLVSLTNNGGLGNAVFNPNVNQSWTLVQSGSPISGFTGASQFLIDTSAFANLPGSSSQFSVATDVTGDNLVLTFTSARVITTILVNQTNNAGTTAVFTVSAAGTTPISYQWMQGSTVLLNGGSSASGGAVTITTNAGDTTSTLMIANVQDADAGLISVNVTNAGGGVGASSATLSIIDPPSNPQVTQSVQPVASGEVTHFSVTANGTAPFSYFWSFNGVPLTNSAAISGANSATLNVNTTPSAAGNYSVIVSNAAGMVASETYQVTPVTYVPNQVIYEPFSSYGQMTGVGSPSVTWENVTNLYNELTGEPAYWYHYSGSRVSMIIYPNYFSYFTDNGGPGYPWPGLAGDSPQCMDLDVNSSETDNDHLQFSVSGFNPGQSVYFSCLLNCDTFGGANVSDCIAAFCSSDDGTSFNLKLSTQIQTDGSYWLGLSKGSGVSGNQGVDADTMWVTGFQADQDILVVGLYQINSGNITNTDDTVSLWINPTNTSFGTTNVPVPTLGPSTFGAANSAIHTFAIHGVQYPGNRYMSDLRIGTTWASVTPPSGPSITLSNQVITPGSSNLVLTALNAGNPALTYQWYYGNTNGTPLSNGPNPNGDGSTISGASTGTLTISNPKSADLGNYTIVESNTDPVSGNTLYGSAAASVSYSAPPLYVAYNTGSVTISWPTNWVGFQLEETTALAPPIDWSTISSGSYVVSGTNYTVTGKPTATAEFFQLVAP